MTVSIKQPMNASAGAILTHLRDHPELLWGHHAPDLVVDAEFRAHSQHGIAGAGVVEAVSDEGVDFTWGEETWPQPGRFRLLVSDGGVTLTGGPVPDERLSAMEEHWRRCLAGWAELVDTPNPESSELVRAVLFDADGVLQMPREGWLARMIDLGGDGFIEEAFGAEIAVLDGSGDLATSLRRILDARERTATVEQVLEVWHDIVMDDEVLTIVDDLRRDGIICALATNQQSYRGTHMREVLGLQRHFDAEFYSYELGHAKPSAAYFYAVLERLGLPAGQVAFVDDAVANVVAARRVGIRSVLHRHVSGAEGVRADLRGLGVSA